MKKILIACLAVGVLVFGLVFYKLSHPSIAKKVENLKEEMKSYELEATMKMLDGEDLRTFLVEVNYLKDGDKDLFAVELLDQSSKQEQKIIRNADGVFVIAPSLNRAFQFQSEWPFNSFKPYIVQTIFEVFDGEYEQQKIDGGYQVSAMLSYPSDPRVTHMDVVFDDDVNLKNVTLFDDNESEIIMLDVTKFKWNEQLDKENFKVNANGQVSSDVSFADDLPFYPLENLGNELVDQTKTDINGNEKHILRFSGEDYFTIIENSLSKSDEFVIEAVNGDPLEIFGAVAFINDEVVTLLDGDVMCQIYSNELSMEEKLQIIGSMQNSVVMAP